MDKYSVGCNSVSMPELPASDAKDLHFISNFPNSFLPSAAFMCQ